MAAAHLHALPLAAFIPPPYFPQRLSTVSLYHRALHASYFHQSSFLPLLFFFSLLRFLSLGVLFIGWLGFWVLARTDVQAGGFWLGWVRLDARAFPLKCAWLCIIDVARAENAYTPSACCPVIVPVRRVN